MQMSENGSKNALTGKMNSLIRDDQLEKCIHMNIVCCQVPWCTSNFDLHERLETIAIYGEAILETASEGGRIQQIVTD